MRILSASEAVSPAIARAKLILFKPFRLGRSWKFSATAYISTTGTFFFPFPLLFLFAIPSALHYEPKWLIWAIVPVVALLLALTLFLFVLCSRLQFPFMDIVMNRSVFVAPLWRQYGPQARRWTQAKIVIGTIISLVLAVPFGALICVIVRGMGSHLAAHTPQQIPPFIAVFYLIFLLVYSGLGLVMITMSLLNDFMLPVIALEDATVSDAWQWVVKFLRAEPGQTALYALLKIVLGFIVQMACAVIMELVLFLMVMFVAFLGLLFSLLLHAFHMPDVILQVLGMIAFACLYLGFIGYAAPFANGISMVFLEAYKLFFLGGRCPPLGDLLDRSTPPPEPLPPAPQFGYVPLPPSSPHPEPIHAPQTHRA